MVVWWKREAARCGTATASWASTRHAMEAIAEDISLGMENSILCLFDHFHLIMLLAILSALTLPLSAVYGIELPPGYSRGVPLTWFNADLIPTIPAYVQTYDFRTYPRLASRQGCPKDYLMCVSGWCCNPGGNCCGDHSCCPHGYVLWLISRIRLINAPPRYKLRELQQRNRVLPERDQL